MDRSFHGHLILETMTNPARVTHKIPSNSFEKIHCHFLGSRCYSYYVKFTPFQES